MLKIEYDSKKDLMQVNDWQKESNMQEVLTLLMILWDETILCGKGTITDEILFKEMKELSRLRLDGKDEKEVFKEHFIKPSYTDLEKEIKELQEENKMQDHELERLRNIIKEVREFISNHFIADDGAICKELEERFCEINYSFIDELLEILGSDK